MGGCDSFWLRIVEWRNNGVVQYSTDCAGIYCNYGKYIVVGHPMPHAWGNGGGPRVVTTPEVGNLDGRNVLVFAPGSPGLFAHRSFEKKMAVN